MKTLTIQIHTRDWRSIHKLLEKSNLSKASDEIQVSDQVRLRYDGVTGFKGVEFPDIYELALIFSGVSFTLAIELTAALLYDILKGEKDTTKLLIEKTTIEIEQEEIKRVIREKLEIK